MVVRTVEEEPKTSYALSNAPPEVSLAELIGVRTRRYWIEPAFEALKGEAGLDHYEVRSWVGWHHHITLALLATWFLVLEKLELGGKNPGRDGAPGAGDLQPVAPESASEPGTNREGSNARAAA